jgi:hypothetical protein
MLPPSSGWSGVISYHNIIPRYNPENFALNALKYPKQRPKNDINQFYFYFEYNDLKIVLDVSEPRYDSL